MVLVWAGTAIAKQLADPVPEISGTWVYAVSSPLHPPSTTHPPTPPFSLSPTAKFPVFVTDGLSQAAFALVAFAALCALHGLGKVRVVLHISTHPPTHPTYSSTLFSIHGITQTVLGRVRGPGATAETIPPPSPEGMRAASQALLKP